MACDPHSYAACGRYRLPGPKTLICEWCLLPPASGEMKDALDAEPNDGLVVLGESGSEEEPQQTECAGVMRVRELEY